MNQRIFILFLTLLSLLSGCKKENISDLTEQAIYEINENGTYQDFLTPNYYNVNNTDLRNKINKFIHFIKLGDYQHPFENSNGDIASHTTNRRFGDGTGMGGTSQHHPAIDLHPSNPTDITIYAVHEGTIKTYKDSPKYRHYVTITKEIKDSENNAIGKLVSLYAHIDLDLDESESIQLNDLSVNKGDVVSKNLYSGTVGGPHLHFEIRFYRTSEIGNEDFYNWQNNGDYTKLSSGSWSYGYWDPNVGYGFCNPINIEIE